MLDKFLEWLLNIITNPLFVSGLLIIFIVSILKDEKSVAGGAKRAKFFKNELRPLPNWIYSSMIILGLISSAAGIIQVFTKATIPTAGSGGVSLVSMKYESGGWNPHHVDLQTAGSSGIPAGAGPDYPLKFSEMIVFAPSELAGFRAWAEFIANGNEKIGETSVAILQPGLTTLGNINIVDAYRFLDNKTGKYSDDSWDVQKNWNTIDVNLKYESASGQVGSTIWKIKLNQMSGTAWWNSPPDVNIVSVVYSVDDGLQQVLDLRREPKPVIHAQAGDWITIHAIWYKANSNNINNQSMFIGGSINNGQQEFENKSSDMAVIREGIHLFENFKPMTWIISSDIKQLGLIAIRSDDTVLDGYVIDISDTEKSGLVSTQKSVVWPFSQVNYLDFEKNDLEMWEVEEANSLSISANEAFSGAYSLSVTTKSNQSQVYIIRNFSFKSDLIIGHVLWPPQDGVKVEWAQACVYGTKYCATIWQDTNRWNTFVMDFSHTKDDNGNLLSAIEMSALLIQGQISGVGSDNPYTFYLDGIEIYPSRTP